MIIVDNELCGCCMVVDFKKVFGHKNDFLISQKAYYFSG